MSDTSGQNGLVYPDRSGEQGPAESQVPGPASRQRRGLRITLVSLASLVVFLGAVAAGGYVFVNHLAGGIQRIPVKFARLDAASQPGKGTTVLITGAGIGPTGEPTAGQALGESGLIMLLHVNADGRAGGVVSIPPLAIVKVPGHGQMQIRKSSRGRRPVTARTDGGATYPRADQPLRAGRLHSCRQRRRRRGRGGRHPSRDDLGLRADLPSRGQPPGRASLRFTTHGRRH